ncbi:MAG: CHRD domain-containing protein [Candidatus Nitrosopolaris sp.]
MSVLITSIIVTALVATPISSYAQQQMNFAATLTGKDMAPPVNTPATGVASFHINPDGSLCYSVDVSHITGVLGAHIGTKNGTEIADLINPYAVIATQQAYPTADVNGILTSGDIKAGLIGKPGSFGVLSPLGLVGPLIGKNVTDLDKIVKSNNGYVTVRTVDHQGGEIQGQIHPSNSTVSCLTTLRFAAPSTEPSPNSTRY